MPKRKTTKKKTGTKRRGKGWIGDIFKGGAKILAPVLVDALGNLVKRKVEGMGKKKKATKKRSGKSVKVKMGKSVRP